MQSLIEYIKSKYEKTSVKLAHLLTVTTISSGLTLQHLGEPAYHLSGFVSSVIARAIDISSTIQVIKLMNTDEFKDSGLGESWYEKNRAVGKHPTLKEFYERCAFRSGLSVLCSTFCPPAGYADLSIVPIIASKNRDFTKGLEFCLENGLTGDDIKDMFSDGVGD